MRTVHFEPLNQPFQAKEYKDDETESESDNENDAEMEIEETKDKESKAQEEEEEGEVKEGGEEDGGKSPRVSRSRSRSRSPSPTPTKRKLDVKLKPKPDDAFFSSRSASLYLMFRALAPLSGLRELIIGADKDNGGEHPPLSLALTSDHMRLLSQIKQLQILSLYFFDFETVGKEFYHINNMPALQEINFYYAFNLKTKDDPHERGYSLGYLLSRFAHKQPSLQSITFFYKPVSERRYRFYPIPPSEVELNQQLHDTNEMYRKLPSLIGQMVIEDRAQCFLRWGGGSVRI